MQERAQLHEGIVRVVESQFEAIVNDAMAVLPFAGSESLDSTGNARLCEGTLRLLVAAIRDGEVDPRSDLVADVHALTRRHAIGSQQLFELTYLLERTALDEAALDESLGATSEQWPAVAQIVRRASFDCLAAFAERLRRDPEAAIIDGLTTIHSRTVLDAVLEKEIHRAERFGHPLALILLDVDRLSQLNAAHGYGFGERVLERIGIVMRNYFREHDWVARHGEDSFAVLLPETPPDRAEQLADQVRAMVEERLALRDHRNDVLVQVTVSVAVLVAPSVAAAVDAAQVIAQAEEAVQRAKVAGRNRVERVDLTFTPDATVDLDERRRRPQT